MRHILPLRRLWQCVTASSPRRAKGFLPLTNAGRECFSLVDKRHEAGQHSNGSHDRNQPDQTSNDYRALKGSHAG